MEEKSKLDFDTGISEVIGSARVDSIFKLKAAAAAAKLVYEALSDKVVIEKINSLSVLRNESLEKTTKHVIGSAFKMVPKNLDRLDMPSRDDVVAIVERESADIFKISTTDGLVFRDWEGAPKHKALYWFVRDKIKKTYQCESFFAGSAVNRSFVNGVGRFPGDRFIPRNGGVVIEAGAYVGYKTVSFGRFVGKNGKVFAIEASPKNYKLLKMNVIENGLSDYVQAVHCAVWKSDGNISLKSKGRMQHTVAKTDELNYADEEFIPGKCLDSLIDEFGVDQVDFLNLQLNGAEIEAIEGLQKNFNKVRYINIITRYNRDGQLVVDIAKKMLEERGCSIVVDSRADRLFNLTARNENYSLESP